MFIIHFSFYKKKEAISKVGGIVLYPLRENEPRAIKRKKERKRKMENKGIIIELNKSETRKKCLRALWFFFSFC